MSLWGGGRGVGVVEDKKGASFWRGPPPRVLWLRSAAAAAPRVRQRRTASKRDGHTQKSAQLCAWLEGGRGGGVDGFVEWGRRGWVVLEEEEEGKERKTHQE